jgi:spermidine synthase
MALRDSIMAVLHDAPGRQRRITVTEREGTRYLHLDGCEEGAMAVGSDDPVFQYLWLHKVSSLADGPVRRILVLGAGAFAAPKCLARDYPDADVDAVDIEPDLEPLGRKFFELDRPEFAHIRFRGMPADDFLAAGPPAYEVIFDDLFDGFQHVPREGRGEEHMNQLRAALAPGGVCVKNLIWDPRSADTRAACEETATGLKTVFPNHFVVALGDAAGGHNRLLIGLATARQWSWPECRVRLAEAGVPFFVLAQAHLQPRQS